MANHANDPTAPKAAPVSYPEHYSTEPDNTHRYVPKGQIDITSMQKTRFQIPAEIFGPVRNLAIVCLTESANTVERLRCWEQLKKMSESGDVQAQTIVDALRGLVIDCGTL